MAISPYKYIDSTGIIIADTSVILTEIQDEFLVTWPDLVVTSDTPQGVLIAGETIARSAVVNNNAAVANQFNPNIAGGVFLDGLLALTGMQRTSSTPTSVSSVTVTGVAGTVIPAGSQAQTAAGDVFQSITLVTLDGSGNGSVNFQSMVEGAIPCAISALNMIVTNVLGWETVNNTIAGLLGTSTQSDQAARVLRQNTLAFQAVSLPEAITSALYNVSGVQSLIFQENIADTTQVINGISMISHSIYACVNGGADKDVAAALLENKSSGCGWNGGTSVSVVEPASDQSYTVKFDRPTPIGVLVKVTTTNGNSTDITNAILNYVNGLVNGFAGAVVGADISCFEIAAAIAAQFPQYYLSNVQTSLVSPVVYQNIPIPIAVNQIAQITAGYISIVVSS